MREENFENDYSTGRILYACMYNHFQAKYGKTVACELGKSVTWEEEQFWPVAGAMLLECAQCRTDFPKCNKKIVLFMALWCSREGWKGKKLNTVDKSSTSGLGYKQTQKKHRANCEWYPLSLSILIEGPSRITHYVCYIWLLFSIVRNVISVSTSMVTNL